MSDPVVDRPLNSARALEYLDSTIRHWRKNRDQEVADSARFDAWAKEHASYYIDAFQSARMTLFSGPLPADSDDAPSADDELAIYLADQERT